MRIASRAPFLTALAEVVPSVAFTALAAPPPQRSRLRWAGSAYFESYAGAHAP